jgi:hypothetical protein
MEKKLIYIHYDGFTPKLITQEEAIDHLASADHAMGISDKRKYAEIVLTNMEACGNSAFQLSDSETSDILMICLQEGE